MQSDTFAARLGRLMAHVPDLTLERLDDLAGLARGHAGQLLRGVKEDPRRETVERIAPVFGARPGWLTYGEGAEPSARTVRGAVARAEEEHPAPVRSRA